MAVKRYDESRSVAVEAINPRRLQVGTKAELSRLQRTNSPAQSGQCDGCPVRSSKDLRKQIAYVGLGHSPRRPLPRERGELVERRIVEAECPEQRPD